MSMDIRITAHSGCENTPDNSTAYLKKALELPCDVIEVDVRCVKDRLLLSHNEIEGTEGLLTLEQAMEMVAQKEGVLLNCDLKESGIFQKVVRLAESLGFASRTIYTGSVTEEDFPMEQELRQQVYMNLENVTDVPLRSLERLEFCREDLFRAVDRAAKLSCAGININYLAVDKELTDYVHAKGMRVFVWTVNEEHAMKQMIDAGVDSITTHKITALYKLKCKKLTKI